MGEDTLSVDQPLSIKPGQRPAGSAQSTRPQ
jgi:hypothetical protein